MLLSPGPGHPSEVGVFADLLRILPPATPVLGVCLGHQALGLACGGRKKMDLAEKILQPLLPRLPCWFARESLKELAQIGT